MTSTINTQSVRDYLESKGATFLFDNIVQDLVVEKGNRGATAGEAGGRKVTGIILSDGRILQADAVVLAAGHSARLLYEKLLHHGVDLQPKPIGKVDVSSMMRLLFTRSIM